MPDFSLIITCYNEELYLRENLSRIKKYLDRTRLSYEIIIIDDKSRDSTPSLIRAFAAENPGDRIRTFFHTENVGRGGSVTEGLRAAESPVAGFLDIDLEIPEDYLLNAYLKITEGSDLVLGQRHYNMTFHPKSITRYVISVGYRFMVNSWLKLPGYDTESGFKFFNMKTVGRLLGSCVEKGWFWDTEIVARAERSGMRIFKLRCLFLRNTVKRSSVRLGTDIPYYIVKLARFRRLLQ